MKTRTTYDSSGIIIIACLCLMVAAILLPPSALTQTEPCSVELIGSCNGSTDCSGSLSGGMEIENTSTSAITCKVVSVFSGSEPVGTGGSGVGGFEEIVSLSSGQSSIVFGWFDQPISEIPFWEFHPMTESGTSSADCYVTDNPETTCEAYDEWECSATCDPTPVSVEIKHSSISLKGKGLLSFVIIGADDFDATTVDPATIRLGREGVRYMVTPLRWNYKGNDLGLKFDKSAVVNDLMLGDVAGQEVQLIITGKLKNEFGKTPFMGTFDVWVNQ
jgi:hypothetical protein